MIQASVHGESSRYKRFVELDELFDNLKSIGAWEVIPNFAQLNSAAPFHDNVFSSNWVISRGTPGVHLWGRNIKDIPNLNSISR